jgi:hypothetical protein
VAGRPSHRVNLIEIDASRDSLVCASALSWQGDGGAGPLTVTLWSIRPTGRGHSLEVPRQSHLEQDGDDPSQRGRLYAPGRASHLVRRRGAV